MFDLLKEDVLRQADNKGVLKVIRLLLLSHTVHLLILFRFGCWVDRNIPFFGVFIRHLVEYAIRVIFASDISCKATIGGGLNFMHGHDIVIGSKVVIGKNCKIFNGVSLGNKDTQTYDVAQPTIGDDVLIGSGAKILGGVVIGDRVKIGANSVVIKNIDSDSIWAGVPAKCIKSLR